jgi:hypothetical protein
MGMHVDADGFVLVQSRRRWRRHAPPHPRRQRPVQPSLVGLCFNCLAKDHIAAQCAFASRCLLCLSTVHRARNCMHDRSRSSDRLQAPTKRGPRRHVPDGNHGRPDLSLRRPRLRDNVDGNDDDSQGASGAPESQLWAWEGPNAPACASCPCGRDSLPSPTGLQSLFIWTTQTMPPANGCTMSAARVDRGLLGVRSSNSVVT